MFNTKLKKQIKSLEDELVKVKEKYTEKCKDLEDRTRKLENPPKYKVGDKVGKDYVVNNVKFKEKYWDYTPAGCSYTPAHWSYTLTNIKTGETKTI